MPINDRNKYEFEWAKAIAQGDIFSSFMIG